MDRGEQIGEMIPDGAQEMRHSDNVDVIVANF